MYSLKMRLTLIVSRMNMQTVSMTFKVNCNIHSASLSFIGTNKMERGKEAGEGNGTDVWHGN